MIIRVLVILSVINFMSSSPHKGMEYIYRGSRGPSKLMFNQAHSKKFILQQPGGAIQWGAHGGGRPVADSSENLIFTNPYSTTQRPSFGPSLPPIKLPPQQIIYDGPGNPALVCLKKLISPTGYWDYIDQKVNKFNKAHIVEIPNNWLNTIMVSKEGKPKIISELEGILSGLKPGLKAYWLINNRKMSILTEVDVNENKAFFILYDGAIRYVEEKPLKNDLEGLWFNNELKFAKLIQTTINNEPSYLVFLDGYIYIYKESTLVTGTSLVYDGTLTYAMKVDTLKTDGYFDPNKSFEFIPVEFRPDNAPDEFVAQPLEGSKGEKRFIRTTPNDPQVIYAVIGGKINTLKLVEYLNNGYVKGGKTINTEVFPDTVDNVPGYWIFDVNNELMYVKEVPRNTPGGFDIIYEGKKIYVVRVVQVEQMSGYFTYDNKKAFIKSPVSQASVASKKGFWILKENKLFFAKEEPLSIRKGLYLTYKGKQYHVSLKDIKATGLWEGKGPLENRNFKQADIRSATLGNIPGLFATHNGVIEFYRRVEKGAPDSTLLVYDGTEIEAVLEPLEIRQDGYFDIENNQIKFVYTEITPSISNEKSGYWITVKGDTTFYEPIFINDQSGIWIVTNRRLEHVASQATPDEPRNFPEMIINSKPAFVTPKDDGNFLVQETKLDDPYGYNIYTEKRGKIFVRPLDFTGVVSSNNGVLQPEIAKISQILINKQQGFLIEMKNKENMYVKEEVQAKDGTGFDIIVRGEVIPVVQMTLEEIQGEGGNIKIMHQYSISSYNVVTKDTPGAKKLDINGQTVYVSPA